jgi:dihydropyrimidinase
MDLVIRGGTVVNPGGRAEVDIAVHEGRVVQLGRVTEHGERELEANGRYVLPGGFDAHVHLTPGEVESGSVNFVDDFASGSRAAAAGGVTTLGNISYARPRETLRAALERIETAAEKMSLCDFVQTPVFADPSPESRSELPELAKLGHTSLKIFMTANNFAAEAGEYLKAMELAGRSGMLTLIHCEDGALLSYVVQRMLAEGRGDPVNWAASRPTYSEAVSTSRAVAFCQATGAPIYVVHLASKAALEVTRQARASGLPVFVETRPMFLHLTNDRLDAPDGRLYVGAPPLGTSDDVAALWGGLHDGAIQTMCSDHGPWSRKDKLEPTRTIANMAMGVADVETNLPLLFSEGVLKNRISLERFVELTSTNAAKLFGVYPRKGTISVGSDADITIWDPQATRTVRAAEHHSNADYSPYEGWSVTGLPIHTIRRGELIYTDGEVVRGATHGQALRRLPVMFP